MPQTNKKEIILHHEGLVEYETIGNLISQLKYKMSVLGVKLVTFKKILLILIESLENISKYYSYLKAYKAPETEVLPQFILIKSKQKFIIKSSNIILNKDIKTISERIDKLNNLNKEELRALYKSTITNGQFTEKGGAGLGFIEMTRISDEKMKYSFEPIDDKYSNYQLKIVICDKHLDHENK